MRRVASADAPVRVVTFDCYHDEPGTARPGFGEAFFDAEGIGAIHVLTAGNDWYQYADLTAALAAVRAAAGRPLLAYGSSMGGYAAVRFADAVGANRVLALSPQYSIDPRKAPFETRWTQERRHIRFRRDLDGPIVGHARTIIVYDPSLIEDRHHADRIAADVAVERMALLYAGHPSAPFLSDLGLLRPLVHAMLDGKADIAAIGQDAMRQRRCSPTWLGELAARQPSHRPRTSIALAERAAALAPDSPAVLDRLALRLRAAGRHARAIEVHRAVVTLARLPNYLWGLSKSLFAAGRIEEALATASDLQVAAPAVAGYHRWAAELRLLLGDRAGAIADLRRAIAAAPAHRGYRWTLRWQRLLRLLGR